MKKLASKTGQKNRSAAKRPDFTDHPWLKEAPQFSGELRSGADHFIAESSVYGEVMLNQLEQSRELNKVADRVRIATQKQHIEAVAFAYAFWIKASKNAAYSSFLGDAAKGWKRITRSTTGLHLIVARFVSYGDDDSGPTGKKKGLYNRDVRAILWLHSQGVPPNRVVELGSKHGEGLRAWEQRNRKSRVRKAVNDGAERIQQKHTSKWALLSNSMPWDSSTQVCLSYRVGTEEAQHLFLNIINSPEAAKLIYQFRSDMEAEAERKLRARVNTYRAVTGLGSITSKEADPN